MHTFHLPSVYLRAVGGEVGATSSLAPKIGPLGLVRDNECMHSVSGRSGPSVNLVIDWPGTDSVF